MLTIICVVKYSSRASTQLFWFVFIFLGFSSEDGLCLSAAWRPLGGLCWSDPPPLPVLAAVSSVSGITGEPYLCAHGRCVGHTLEMESLGWGNGVALTDSVPRDPKGMFNLSLRFKYFLGHRSFKDNSLGFSELPVMFPANGQFRLCASRRWRQQGKGREGPQGVSAARLHAMGGIVRKGLGQSFCLLF